MEMCKFQKKNRNCVFALFNDCYSNDKDIPNKTHNCCATTADKDHNVTVCNHTSGLEPNYCKISFGKEYLASCIQNCGKIPVRCNSCHRSGQLITSELQEFNFAMTLLISRLWWDCYITLNCSI